MLSPAARSLRGVRGGLLTYSVTAVTARTATEAAGPALLLSSAALGRPHSAGAVLVSCVTVSAAVTGPLVGSLLDRTRRPTAVFLAAMALLAAGFLVLLTTSASTPLVLVAAVTVVAGLGTPALTGGWSAQLPRIVAPARHATAFAVDAASYNLGSLAGPALAGLLLGLGVKAPLLGVVLVVLVPALVLPAVRLERRAAAGRDAGGPATTQPRTRIVDGLRAMVVRPGLRSSVVVTTVGLAGQAAVVVCAPAVAHGLGHGTAFAGTFLTVYAVGGLGGTLLQAVHPLPRPQVVTFGATIIVGLTMAGLAGAVVLGSTPWTLAAVFLTGVADGVLSPAMFTVRSKQSPEGTRGQVFTVAASLRSSSWAVAAAALAPIVDRPVAALLVGAGIQVVAVVLGVLTALPGGVRLAPSRS